MQKRNMDRQIITEAFITNAAKILGDTNDGLKGSEICKYLVNYAVQYNRDIPFTTYPFMKQGSKSAISKKEALQLNLECFSDKELYVIISGLCKLEKFNNNKDVGDLKLKLSKDYHSLAPVGEIEENFIEETSHWLKSYPNAFDLYNNAYQKYKSEDEQLYRNTLDDARLALEKLLKEVLKNKKSIENQQEEIGSFVSERGGTKEFSNMFRKLLKHYSKYQNERVKHDDNIVKTEITFIFELTTVFMRQLVRLNSQRLSLI